MLCSGAEKGADSLLLWGGHWRLTGLLQDELGHCPGYRHRALSRLHLLTSREFLNSLGIKSCPRVWVGAGSPFQHYSRSWEDWLWSYTIQGKILALYPNHVPWGIWLRPPTPHIPQHRNRLMLSSPPQIILGAESPPYKLWPVLGIQIAPCAFLWAMFIQLCFSSCSVPDTLPHLGKEGFCTGHYELHTKKGPCL